MRGSVNSITPPPSLTPPPRPFANPFPLTDTWSRGLLASIWGDMGDEAHELLGVKGGIRGGNTVLPQDGRGALVRRGMEGSLLSSPFLPTTVCLCILDFFFLRCLSLRERE